MSLIEYAESELMLADVDQATSAMVLDIVARFSMEGHSGTSALYAISIIHKLLNFCPLTPLTGEDSEWNEVADGIYQRRTYLSKYAYHVDNRDAVITFPYEVR